MIKKKCDCLLYNRQDQSLYPNTLGGQPEHASNHILKGIRKE